MRIAFAFVLVLLASAPACSSGPTMREVIARYEARIRTIDAKLHELAKALVLGGWPEVASTCDAPLVPRLVHKYLGPSNASFMSTTFLVDRPNGTPPTSTIYADIGVDHLHSALEMVRHPEQGSWRMDRRAYKSLDAELEEAVATRWIVVYDVIDAPTITVDHGKGTFTGGHATVRGVVVDLENNAIRCTFGASADLGDTVDVVIGSWGTDPEEQLARTVLARSCKSLVQATGGDVECPEGR